MRKIVFFILIVMAAGAVYAQSTAEQGILGSLSTSCPGSFTVCFVQYSASNPMPVVSN